MHYCCLLIQYNLYIHVVVHATIYVYIKWYTYTEFLLYLSLLLSFQNISGLYRYIGQPAIGGHRLVLLETVTGREPRWRAIARGMDLEAWMCRVFNGSSSSTSWPHVRRARRTSAPGSSPTAPRPRSRPSPPLFGSRLARIVTILTTNYGIK